MLLKKLSPCFAAFAILVACVAYADGVIIPVKPISRRMPPPLSIKYHHVDVTINNQLVRTEVDQVFKNNFGSELEGIYIFPIPSGAAINDFSLYVGGEKIDARLLDRESALRIYEDIVRRRKDPALLEYAGREMFKARVYPIPAHGERRVGLAYTEMIGKDANLCSYRYSLNTEKFSPDPLDDVSVKIAITSAVPIVSIYSPTHEIQIERSGPTEAVVTYYEKNVKPDKDFVIYYRLSKEQMGVSLLSYKERRGDGYFLLLVSPNDWSIDQKVMPKDVVFVFDRSGSMSGKKIEQARSSLAFCLNSLNQKDRFALITFNDAVDEFSASLLRASRENVEDAKEFIRRLSASGGTDIHGALVSGLSMLESNTRPKMLLFLTDGLPTVGITDVNEIVRRVAERNLEGARTFTFGVGYDVNTRLLDRLANENKGSSEYVRPNEDIEIKVSSLYSKITNPVLTDIRIHFGSAGVSDVYPREIPDLFKGSQLVLTGRYRNSGTARVVLEGKMEGRTKRFSYTLAFERKDEENDFIPLLWASRRIGHLVEEIKAHGRNKELVEEIVRLSKRFGILTEYTSFLVDKDVHVALPALREEAEKKLEAAKEVTGSWAVSQSVNAKRMKKSAQVPANTYYDDRGVEQRFGDVVQIGNRAFFNQSGEWVETTSESDAPVIKVKRFSKAYFQLLKNDPSVGSYLALGQNVQFNIGSQQVQIGESGKEEFTETELAELFD